MSKNIKNKDQTIEEIEQGIKEQLDDLQTLVDKLTSEEVEEDFFDLNSPSFKSDEILEEAYHAPTVEAKKKLAKKALKIYPDNIDAESLLASLEENPIKKITAYQKVVEKATKILEENDCFNEDNIGLFWGIIETRPYMRARHGKILALMDLGRYREAMKDCEDLLRLSESDNLGIRYLVMGLYGVLEEFERGEKLLKKYNEKTSFMVLPMAIMYFKKGDYKKARKQLEILKEINPYIIETLETMDSSISENETAKHYSPGTLEEARIIISDFLYLLASVPAFILFAIHESM